MGLIYGTALGMIVVSIGIMRYKTGMILRDDQNVKLYVLGNFYYFDTLCRVPT